MFMKDKWFRTICDSYSKPPVFYRGKPLPGFPSDEIQANTTGQAGAGTLKEAFTFYEDCRATVKRLGCPLHSQHKLLDFGVGWGRISRFFLRELPLENIYGLDVTAEFIAICEVTFSSRNFFTCQAFPPTRFTDGMFNFVVGYSVFSHLSEAACVAWMREFHRLLAPSGLVALTTRGRPFFDYCQSLKDKVDSGYPYALSTLFDDFEDARRRYDRGEFVHSNREGVDGGGAMNAQFYGETFIPEKYAREFCSDLFVLEDFLFEPPRQSHPIMFFRKR